MYLHQSFHIHWHSYDEAMTAFSLCVQHTKPLVAVVAAHGLTDLDSRRWVPPYLVWALAPMPGVILTALFCAASTIHFADDFGPRVSVAVHGTVAAIAAFAGMQTAFDVMLTYLAVVHAPAHYARCYRTGRMEGLALAGAGTALALVAMPYVPNTLLVDHWIQRVVIAHICHEYTLTRS